MNAQAEVKYRCQISQRDKPLILTERTTYRRMDEWTYRG